MTVEITAVLSQNITIAYQSLNLTAIDTRKLKQLATGEVAVMDMPDRIVAVWPSIPLIIELGDNRIRITCQRANPSIGDVPLWEIAAAGDGLVRPSQTVAYGFNYEVQAALHGENASDSLVRRFVPDRLVIEQTLGGVLLQFNPRLVFQREGVQYDVVVEPAQQDSFRVRCNVNFDDTSLPDCPQLRESYRRHYEYLINLVPRLLAQEAER